MESLSRPQIAKESRILFIFTYPPGSIIRKTLGEMILLAANNEFLGTERMGKLLFRLSAPTICAQLINMLYNVVDRMYIGHIPETGALALTGLGVCMPVILVVSAFAAFVSMGGAPRASIAMGRGDSEGAKDILGTCFVLQLLLSALLTAALLLWNRPMLLAFGASSETIDYASDYLTIYAIGTVFVQLTLGMNAFITAQGFSGFGMVTVAIGAVLNIALDPLFIYTFDMGVKGAALATVLSQAVSAVWATYFLTSRRSVLKLERRRMRLRPSILLGCLALGVAPFIMQASESVINVCYNTSLYKYGGDTAVGAMTILSSVMMFAMLPIQGLGQGAQPIISYNYGARKLDRVRKCYKLLLLSGTAFCTVLWAAVQLFPGAFARMFTPDETLVAYAKDMLRVYMAMSLLFGVQIACQMTFISIGYAKESVCVALARKVALLIPLIYLLPHLIPDQTLAVFLAEPVADTLAVTFTAILFAVKFKKLPA